MSSANNKTNKYESHLNRKPYLEDERHRPIKKYDSPHNNRPLIRRQQDMRRGHGTYRDDRDSRNSRDKKHQQQDRSREYTNVSRPSHNYDKKESIGDSSNRYYHELKRYNDNRRQRSKSRDKSHSKHRSHDNRSRGYERSRSRQRNRGRHEHNFSVSRSRSRRRYRSPSRSSRNYSRSRSYSRRTGSYSSGHSNDNRRRRSGHDHYSKRSNDRMDGRSKDRERDKVQKTREFPERSERKDGKNSNNINKPESDSKINRESRPSQQTLTRDNKDPKDQRGRQPQTTNVNKDNRYPTNVKDKSKPEYRIYFQKQRHSNKQAKQNTSDNLEGRGKSPTILIKSQPFQERVTSTLILEQNGPFLKNPPEQRPPIQIELEQLSHQQKPFFTLDQQSSKYSKRSTADTKIHPQEQLIGSRPLPISRPKREKESQPVKHESIFKPAPLPKLVNETQELIKSIRALTNFRLPESNFMIVESFRRLDGYEFELEGLTPEWRGKLEDDKSNINLLRSEWMNMVQSGNGINGNKKNSIDIESSQGMVQSMIPPRHIRLEKSQFINPEHEDKLEQIADAIRSKTRVACEASRKLIQTEVQLQSLLAKRLQI